MSKFVPNPGFIREYQREPFYEHVLEDGAELAKAMAIAIAPYDPGGRGPTYRDSFLVVEEAGEIRLGNSDYTSHFLEWGTIDTPTFAVLRRSVIAAGMELKEASKFLT